MGSMNSNIILIFEKYITIILNTILILRLYKSTLIFCNYFILNEVNFNLSVK